MDFRRCYACMRELDTPGVVCPYCGFDNTADPARQPGYVLPCGTILAGRYITGRMLGRGGFGITYIGYDLTLDRRICVKEYFPEGAARSTAQRRAVFWDGSSADAEGRHEHGQRTLLARREVDVLGDELV